MRNLASHFYKLQEYLKLFKLAVTSAPSGMAAGRLAKGVPMPPAPS
jgi:hypothetical protein